MLSLGGNLWRTINQLFIGWASGGYLGMHQNPCPRGVLSTLLFQFLNMVLMKRLVIVRLGGHYGVDMVINTLLLVPLSWSGQWLKPWKKQQ